MTALDEESFPVQPLIHRLIFTLGSRITGKYLGLTLQSRSKDVTEDLDNQEDQRLSDNMGQSRF